MGKGQVEIKFHFRAAPATPIILSMDHLTSYSYSSEHGVHGDSSEVTSSLLVTHESKRGPFVMLRIL
jgi:hypothetical protein